MLKSFCLIVIALITINAMAESGQNHSSGKENKVQSTTTTREPDNNKQKKEQAENKKPNMAEYCRKHTC